MCKPHFPDRSAPWGPGVLSFIKHSNQIRQQVWTGIEDKFGLRVLLVPKCVLQGQPHAVCVKHNRVPCPLGKEPDCASHTSWTARPHGGRWHWLSLRGVRRAALDPGWTSASLGQTRLLQRSSWIGAKDSTIPDMGRLLMVSNRFKIRTRPRTGVKDRVLVCTGHRGRSRPRASSRSRKRQKLEKNRTETLNKS